MNLKEDILSFSGIEINEGFSKVLYHTTTMQNIIGILKNDVIRLSKNRWTKEGFYSFSLSRDASKWNNEASVCFDGEKLGNNFKSEKINHLGIEARKANADYAEERIVSKEEYLKNIVRCIKKIVIHPGNRDAPDQLIDLCKKNNIKIIDDGYKSYRSVKNNINRDGRKDMDLRKKIMTKKHGYNFNDSIDLSKY